MKRYILSSPAFVAATLLTAGSIITDDDLGTKEVPVLDKDGKPTGKTKRVQVRPPADAIEVDAKGQPVDAVGAAALAAVATEPVQIAAMTAGVAPAAPAEPDAGDAEPADEGDAPAAPVASAEAPRRRNAS